MIVGVSYMNNKQIKSYIDIFAGCGGLSSGLISAGWTGIFAIEKNIDAFATLKYNLIDVNNHFLWPDWLPMKEWDINEVISTYASNLLSLRGKIELVAGGPPCQGFSLAGKRDENDKRNRLVTSYIKFIKLVLPEAIFFENVHGFTVNFKNKTGIKKYSSYVEEELKQLGYKTAHRIIDMSEFGIPQNRKRFILVAFKHHDPESVFDILYENKLRFCDSKGIPCKITIYEAISDLEKGNGVKRCPDTKGFCSGVYGPVNSGYQKLMRQFCDDKNGAPVDSHRFVNHKAETIALHEDLLKYAPKGKRITPADNIIPNLNRRGVTVLAKDLQAPTVTSIPDELIHYKEPRILTVREQARIQSFPDWFKFKGKYTSGGKRRKQEVPRYTQVGNAVPPLFAEQLGIAILEVLSKNETKCFNF